MAEDRIDSYVDRTGFNSDTEFVLGQLNTIYTAFKKLDDIKISLGKSSGLGELIPLIKQANDEFGKATDAQNKLADQSAKAQLKISDSLKDTIRQQVEYKKKLEEINAELKKLNKDKEIFDKVAGNDEAKKQIDDRILKLEEERALLKIITGEIEKQVSEQAKRQVQVEGPSGEAPKVFDQLPIEEIRKLTVVQDDNIRSRQEWLTISAQLKNENNLIGAEIRKLNSEFEAGVISQDEYVKALADVKERQTAIGVATESVNRILKNQEKQFQSSGGSTNALRAELNQLLQIFDSFTPEKQLDEVGQKLKQRIDEVTEAITKQEQSTGRFQRNVGNYANSLSGAFSKISDEISNLQQKNETIKSQFQNLTGRTQIKGFSGGNNFNDQTKAQVAALTNEYEKNEAALQQLQATQKVGFKVGANQTQQVKQLEQAYIAFATSGNQSVEFLEAFKNEVGEVKDTVNDLKDSINLAASDTRHLDVFIGTAQAIAGGFGIAQGAAAAFGDENQDLQKQLVKLNGVMTILNGLQAIQAELKKKDNIFTIAQIALQKTYAFVVGTSTGALKAFRIALASTGVGLLVLGLTTLISKLDIFGSSANDAVSDVDKLTDAIDRQQKALDRLNDSIDTTGQIRRERLKQQGVDQQKLFEDELNDKKKQNKNIIEEEKFANQQLQKLQDDHNADRLNRKKIFEKKFNKKLSDQEVDLLFTKEEAEQFSKDLTTLQDKVLDVTDKRTKKEQEIELFSEQRKTKIYEDGIKSKEDADKKAKEKGKEATEAAKRAAEERAAIAERNRRAIFELQKLDIEVDARNQQKIIDNDKAAGKEKLSALIQYTLDKQNIIELSAEFEKKTGKKTAKEIELIEKKKLDDITQLYEDFTTKRDDILSRDFDPQLKQQSQAFTDAINAGIAAANEALQKGFEKEQEFAEKKKDLYKQLYTELAGLAFDFFTNNIDREKNAIQDQIDLLEKRKAKEIEAINATTTGAEEKAARITIAEKRAQAQREQLEFRQRQLDQQRARFEKAETITNIISETALAVIRALGAKPFTPANIGLAALTGAIGAVQLARAVATPIPRFKTGKNLAKYQSNDNYEGPALVGDGGKKEVIIRENGKTEVTPATPTITHVKKNDIILPDVNMLTDRVIARSISKEYSVNVNGELHHNQQQHTDEIKSELRKGFNQLNSTIKNKKELHFSNLTPSEAVIKFKEANKEYCRMNGLL